MLRDDVARLRDEVSHLKTEKALWLVQRDELGNLRRECANDARKKELRLKRLEAFEKQRQKLKERLREEEDKTMPEVKLEPRASKEIEDLTQDSENEMFEPVPLVRQVGMHKRPPSRCLFETPPSQIRRNM